MLLYIPVTDCTEQIREKPYLLTDMYNLGIDYATNDIIGYNEDKLYRVFLFEDYGMKLDNRWNTYEITCGLAGIMIEILNTRKTL